MDESALLDLLECPVCLERLDASAKVLPCQHTFCKRCLLGIVSSRNELRCPECRTLVDCSVDELPSNILLVRLLDGIKQRPRKPGAGGGTGGTNALRVPITTVANCGSKELPSSQVGQQQRVQARSPPVRVSTEPCCHLFPCCLKTVDVPCFRIKAGSKYSKTSYSRDLWMSC